MRHSVIQSPQVVMNQQKMEEWMSSTFQDHPKYKCDKNLTHLKDKSRAVTIYGRAEQHSGAKLHAVLPDSKNIQAGI